MQVLQEHAHKIAEEGRAQQAEEQAEDNNIVGRLVSVASPQSLEQLLVHCLDSMQFVDGRSHVTRSCGLCHLQSHVLRD